MEGVFSLECVHEDCCLQGSCDGLKLAGRHRCANDVLLLVV